MHRESAARARSPAATRAGERPSRLRLAACCGALLLLLLLLLPLLAWRGAATLRWGAPAAERLPAEEGLRGRGEAQPSLHAQLVQQAAAMPDCECSGARAEAARAEVFREMHRRRSGNGGNGNKGDNGGDNGGKGDKGGDNGDNGDNGGKDGDNDWPDHAGEQREVAETAARLGLDLGFACPRWPANGTGAPRVVELRAEEARRLTAAQLLRSFACSGHALLLRGCLRDDDGETEAQAERRSLEEFAGLLADVRGDACYHASDGACSSQRPTVAQFVDDYLRPAAAPNVTDLEWVQLPAERRGRAPPPGAPPLELRLGGGAYAGREGAVAALVARRWACGLLMRPAAFSLNGIRFARRGYVVEDHSDPRVMNMLAHPHGSKEWRLAHAQFAPDAAATRVLARRGDVLVVPYMLAHETTCVSPTCISMNV